ncbi:MAG: hypothetical protein WC657_06845, partial [Candidatus Paceibacterota bacterium]
NPITRFLERRKLRKAFINALERHDHLAIHMYARALVHADPKDAELWSNVAGAALLAHMKGER